MPNCSPTPRKRPAQCALHAAAPSRVIETLGSLVLVEHPEVKRLRRPTPNELLSGLRKQSCADPDSLYVAPYMQIVEKGSPGRIVAEHGVSKTDDVVACVGAGRCTD